MTKLVWEGKPSTFHINSSEDFGYVNRYSGQETIDNGDGTFTCNALFDEFLLGFHGDIILFSADDFFMGQVESTCEYYDYVAHFYDVIKVEQRDGGGLEVTINYQSSERRRMKCNVEQAKKWVFEDIQRMTSYPSPLTYDAFNGYPLECIVAFWHGVKEGHLHDSHSSGGKANATE